MSWVYMGTHKCLWVSGCLWVSMGTYECLWLSTSVSGYLWVFMGVYGFLGVYARKERHG